MHPRNIYKDNPPDFTRLASDYPEFAALCSIDLNGKAHLDFKNPEAVRILSTVLLKKDFGLNVELPTDSLVPRVPLRLNYILWIEDLLNGALHLSNDQSERVRGIDVGTGASCVYPLLGASLNGWNFVATEKNAAASASARENVKRNKFESKISIHEVAEHTALLPVVGNITEDFHFTMCNPPFYDSHDRDETRQRPSRSQPHSTTIAKPDEIWAEGGEVAFVSRIIHDSQVLKTKIKIYTTMLGIKASLSPLKAKLKEAEVSDFVVTTFSQGKTTRWALAWTFVPTINLKSLKSVTSDRRTTFSIPYDQSSLLATSIFEIVAKTLKELQLLIEHKNSSNTSCVATAYQNTWKNSRKRRRAALKSNKDDLEVKRLKIDEIQTESAMNGSSERTTDYSNSSVESPSTKREILVKTKISASAGQLEFEWIEGTDKDNLNQLVQYFRNILKSV